MALIDDIQAGTINNAPGLVYIDDKYAFRNLLRKAKCFHLDDPTSRMISDFSLAVAPDIDMVRQASTIPFPVTWFDIDNKARLQRSQELGIKITDTASGADGKGGAVDRIGWLVEQHPQQQTSYRLTYACVVAQGPIVAPLSFGWDTASNASPWHATDAAHGSITKFDHARLCYGMRTVNDVNGVWLSLPPCTDPASGKYNGRKMEVIELMKEITGELRHLFGLLMALNYGVRTEGPPAPLRTSPIEVKGKTLFPIEHRTLTITLKRKATPETVVAIAVTGIKKRLHDVRGHWREYRNPDGTVRLRVPVKAHERGNEKLGRIIKQYEVKP